MARERAQLLLQRASKITVDTNTKLKELKGMRKLINLIILLILISLSEMVTITSSNDEELRMMEEKILKLNGEIDAYIQRLREQQSYYRSCTS